MNRIGLLTAAVGCLCAAGQAPDPPLADTRLSIHTLVREDIFAGIRDGDLDRLARGERSINVLLEKRPADRPPLLAWKAGALLCRSVLALEADRPAEFAERYARVLDLLAEARRLGPDDPGVAAVTAGMYAVLADRLPEKQRGPAWSAAYDAYRALWKRQSRDIEKLPPHLRGELLGGLAQSAQRTGHTKERDQYLDRLLAVAPDSEYARVAKAWKADPKAASEARLTCLSCHADGRLAARRAALGDK